MDICPDCGWTEPDDCDFNVGDLPEMEDSF